jgi:glycolate oxidase
MSEMFTETDLETMQWVRHVFNPKELANPGKIIPTPRTCGEAAYASQEFKSIDLY